MLTDKEIAEIEWRLKHYHATVMDTEKLLATVKELRKENTEQRELLRKAQDYMRHTPVCRSDRVYRGLKTYDCDCGFAEIEKQIEEAGK